MEKKPKRPTDPMQLAKLIGDIATRQAQGEATTVLAPLSDQLREWMSQLGKIGGKRGGVARAKALSKERKRQIARKAALTRWGKKKP